jgi:glycosyltransferase involved in cell wall biosynthesis
MLQSATSCGVTLKPSIVILTFNSESSIAATLESVSSVSDDIHIVDSFSNDRTLEIVSSLGVTVTQHPFENYGAQRNWAIEALPLKYQWQLHLDADERLTPELAHEISALPDDSPLSGYFLPRMMTFLGRAIRHGGMCPTWHMRLFRSGMGHCEARRYDQHFYVTSRETARLKGIMIDDMRMPLTEWTARHNRWSDAEADEVAHPLSEGRVQGRISGNPVERKRYLRGIYNRTPLFVRPFALFFYRYFIRLGFLDGVEGFIFFVLQTFWFRFLVDAKIFERQRARREKLSQERPV